MLKIRPLDSLPVKTTKIALVPSVFIGQVSSQKYSATQVLNAVKQIGFDEGI
jgi:hypothetical protein